MGCVMVADDGQNSTQSTMSKHQVRVQNMMDTMMEQQKQAVGQFSKEPRILATGETLIPMNYMSGEFPLKYPQSFEQYNIPQQTYMQFINELNGITMPLYEQQQQGQKDWMQSATSGAIRGQNALMAKVGQVQSQQLQIQHTMQVETDKLLFKYNQSLFQQYGLQATSSFLSVAMTNTAQVGIIVKAMAQPQVVYVVQQQPVNVVQAQGQGMEGNNEELPAYEAADEEPPKYTNQ